MILKANIKSKIRKNNTQILSQSIIKSKLNPSSFQMYSKLYTIKFKIRAKGRYHRQNHQEETHHHLQLTLLQQWMAWELIRIVGFSSLPWQWSRTSSEEFLWMGRTNLGMRVCGFGGKACWSCYSWQQFEKMEREGLFSV